MAGTMDPGQRFNRGRSPEASRTGLGSGTAKSPLQGSRGASKAPTGFAQAMGQPSAVNASPQSQLLMDAVAALIGQAQQAFSGGMTPAGQNTPKSNMMNSASNFGSDLGQLGSDIGGVAGLPARGMQAGADIVGNAASGAWNWLMDDDRRAGIREQNNEFMGSVAAPFQAAGRGLAGLVEPGFGDIRDIPGALGWLGETYGNGMEALGNRWADAGRGIIGGAQATPGVIRDAWDGGQRHVEGLIRADSNFGGNQDPITNVAGQGIGYGLRGLMNAVPVAATAAGRGFDPIDTWMRLFGSEGPSQPYGQMGNNEVEYGREARFIDELGLNANGQMNPSSFRNPAYDSARYRGSISR